MDNKRKPTIIDIANNLNISSSTVSRALRNAGKVGEILQSQIIEEAQRIGYKPNQAAKALRNQNNILIGYIAPALNTAQLNDITAFLQDYAKKYDMAIVLGISLWDTTKEIEMLDFMSEKNIEGIIIKSKGGQESIHKMHQLAQAGKKIISILDYISFPKVYSITVDNVYGGYLATKHLIEKGHTNILYFTYKFSLPHNDHSWHFTNERYIGMLKAYDEAGISRPDNLVVYDDSTINNDRRIQTITKCLNEDHDFTAIFSYDELLTKAAISAITGLGKKIPEDYSIVGFDDSLMLNEDSPIPITVIKQPDEQIAFEAINILTGSPENSKADIHGSQYKLSPILIDRGSTKNLLT